MTTDIGKNIIQLDGEDDQQQHRPIVPIVRHVAEITEGATEKSESQDTQTDALDVPFRLVGK